MEDPLKVTDKKIILKTMYYSLLKKELYKRNLGWVLLKCANNEQAKIIMGEVHEEICGSHQAGNKMYQLLEEQVIISRAWRKTVSSMLEDVRNVRNMAQDKMFLHRKRMELSSLGHAKDALLT